MSNDNMKLWNQVWQTDPAITKKVTQRGGFTAICAQAQLKRATELWGPYGGDWGVRDLKYSCIGTPIVGIVLEAIFFYCPDEHAGISFPIASDMPYKANDDCYKKLLTDITTKALSKLGFNSDVFEGMFDDNRYVNQRKAECATTKGKPADKAEPETTSDELGQVACVEFSAALRARCEIEKYVLPDDKKDALLVILCGSTTVRTICTAKKVALPTPKDLKNFEHAGWDILKQAVNKMTEKQFAGMLTMVLA